MKITPLALPNQKFCDDISNVFELRYKSFLKGKKLKMSDVRPGVLQYMTLTPLSTIYQ